MLDHDVRARAHLNRWWADKRVRAGLAGVGLLAGLGAVYGIDLAVSSGEVPLGYRVAGIEVGGLDLDDAEAVLRDEFDKRLREPVTVRADEARATVVPTELGVGIDWQATVQPLSERPLNPFARLMTHFRTVELDAVPAVRDREAAVAVLRAQLGAIEAVPIDAAIVIENGSPVVRPGVIGRMVDWDKTLARIPELFAHSGERVVDASFVHQPPAFTTEAANALGIKEVIGEFTTGGFEWASGVNIRRVAEIVNGAIVRPGDTFSLNGHTGPRGTAQGFIESGIIERGRPARAVGGGISQFATTLYNASYFAGMEDVDHTEHSFYISRYPQAREATVFEGQIDLVFRNTYGTGVLIESWADDSNVTVRMWGTKTVDVQSVPGERYAFTSPNTIELPPGPDCIPTGGGGGFTVADTRIITDHKTGAEVSRNTRTVRYAPIPIVKCKLPDPPPPVIAPFTLPNPIIEQPEEPPRRRYERRRN